MKRKNNFKRKAKKALLTATAATSLLVNNAYDNPLDIIDDASAEDSLEDMDEDKKKSDLKSSLRRLMGQIPLPIRACVLVPLWFIGGALMFAINTFLDYVILPNLQLIIGWLAVLAIVIGIVIAAAMVLFPNLPLSKILNKKVLKLILILIVICGIADKLASLFYPEYKKIKLLIKLASGALIVIIALIKVYFTNRKTTLKVFTDKYQFSSEY